MASNDDLHSFMAAPGQAGGESSAVLNELEQFLQSNERDIQSIADYPSVVRTFIKANSTLLSSAAVERLLSRVVGLESWTWTQVGLESDFLRTWTGLGLEG